MGTVYRAIDTKLTIPVALKTLTMPDDPDAITRFKAEFRTVMKIRHPNLIRLHELFEESGQLFFTMDLVEGVDFLEYVKGDASGSPASGLDDTSLVDPRVPSGRIVSSERIALPRYDPQRLHTSLIQLVQGVMALHDAGIIHRDIKPSNIMVNSRGHLVILDFGLAIDRNIQTSVSNKSTHIVGTVAFMAPEQAASKPLTPAADWYAVGALLYRTLTGHLPHEGNVMNVLMDKQLHEPPPPSKVVSGVPAELDALCVDLLRYDPKARPNGPEILRRLGVRAAQKSSVTRHTTSASLNTQSPFIGRGPEMDMLEKALKDVRPGKSVAVVISGQSGVGKTMLMDVFAKSAIKASPHVLILKGRCYQKESVPFKAFDGIMEEISHKLQSMEEVEVAALLPLHAGLMMQAFPVLRRVKVMANQEMEDADMSPHEQRERLFGALREFFIRLARKRAVVLLIDDLQWADADSKALLNDLLLPPEAPGVLTVATYRGDTPEGIDIPGDVRAMHIRELAPSDSHQLIRELLANEDTDLAPHLIESIAHESNGHPLFIAELVKHVATTEQGVDKVPGLDEVLWDRVRTLDPATQHLLYLVCTSGKPIPLSIAKRAVSMTAAVVDQHIDVLRVGQLVKSRSTGTADTVEPYHDRVRESVVNHLDAQQTRALHRHLALALQTADKPDLEALVDHCLMGGLPAKAAHFAVRAGDKAMGAFAFENAVLYYEFVLKHNPPKEPKERSKLYERLAYALANAGRGKDAADAYLAAVEGAPVESRIDLRRAAAGQLLRSGYMKEGIVTLQRVMKEVRIKYHRNIGTTIMGFLWSRLRLKVRGLNFQPRREHEVPKDAMRRLHTYWDAAMCLAMVDHFRGQYYASRLVSEALDVGVPERLAMALALEAVYISTGGQSNRERAFDLMRRSQALAEESGKPEALFWSTLGRFCHHVMLGDFEVAYQLYPELDARLDKCKDVFWEKSTAELWAIWSVCHTGRYDELQKRMPKCLDGAEKRGDRYAITNLQLGLPSIYWLVQDDPETAIRINEETLARWHRHSYEAQDYHRLLGVANAMLYQGRSPLELIESQWKYLSRAQYLRLELVRLEALQMRGRAYLQAGLAKKAIKDARRILKVPAQWARAIGQLMLAGAHAIQGQKEEAVTTLTRARDDARACHMDQFAMAANWHLGKLIGGEEGQALIREAEAWAASQGIRNWRAFANMLAPGFVGD